MVNPYTTMSGKAKGKGTYSYYPLYGTSQILDGGPDNHHVPGTGYFPGDVFMSQIFRGSTLYIHPLSGTFPNGTATYDGARFRPMEFKGLAGAKAFPTSFGHAERQNEYKLRQYAFKGVASAVAFANTGHGARTDAQGAPASYGYFRPEEAQGVASTKVFPASFGQPNTATEYGRQKVQEWKGIPSAKAL
jgi:hypothetical protein